MIEFVIRLQAITSPHFVPGALFEKFKACIPRSMAAVPGMLKSYELVSL